MEASEISPLSFEIYGWNVYDIGCVFIFRVRVIKIEKTKERECDQSQIVVDNFSHYEKKEKNYPIRIKAFFMH